MADLLSYLTPWSLCATFLALAVLASLHKRWREHLRSREVVDTVAGWPPEAARVQTHDERQAYELLQRAMPDLVVLSQVPLSRFIRVPMRRSYAEWLQRVGSLNADLLLCDDHSRVLAVVDIRATTESDRSKQRHERMANVLKKAGIAVYTWREGALPELQQVRNALAPHRTRAGKRPSEHAESRPTPLIPVAEMHEILADGDRYAAEREADDANEPVPSGFFDDLDLLPAGR